MNEDEEFADRDWRNNPGNKAWTWKDSEILRFGAAIDSILIQPSWTKCLEVAFFLLQYSFFRIILFIFLTNHSFTSLFLSGSN